MKAIIAGSRTIADYAEVERAVEASGINVTVVVSGGARGVDKMGERWAKEHRADVALFIPDWNRIGKKAALVRNGEMADYADALIAVWDGESRGTWHMIKVAKEKGLVVYVHEVSALKEPTDAQH